MRGAGGCPGWLGGSSPLQPRPVEEPIRSILPPKQPESRILLGPWRTLSRRPRPAAEAACLASPAALDLRPCWRGSGAGCSSCSSQTVPGRWSGGSCKGWEEPAPQEPSPEPNRPRWCPSEPTPGAQGPGSQPRHSLTLKVTSVTVGGDLLVSAAQDPVLMPWCSPALLTWTPDSSKWGPGLGPPSGCE